MLDQSVWWKMLTSFYPEVYFHLSEVILTTKNGKSLCFLRRFLGSYTLTSKTYPFFSSLTLFCLSFSSFLSFPLFFGGKISNFLPCKQMDFLLHNSLGISFNSLCNLISDIIFKHQCQIYVFKQLNSKFF